MSLRTALVAGVAAAHKAVKTVETRVYLIRAKTAQPPDWRGNVVPDPAAAIPLTAVVDWKQRSVRTMNGELARSSCTVTFVDTKALAAATNNEGLQLEDQIILTDNTTSPIVAIGGVTDPGTARPFCTEAYL